MIRIKFITGIVLIGAAIAHGQSFVNWENPHVHPLDMTPDGTKLLAVNTPDNRLEVFDISSGAVVHLGAVPVGLDPVSVRAHTNTEAWVVNHISDSVSIVDLVAMNVVATVKTNDEPADVVFAGAPQRAFVSCSQANTVLVFDPANIAAAPQIIAIGAEDPRAMAVSNDGSEVYVAIFESGNGSTLLGGGAMGTIAFPPNVVNDPAGPYGGQNPPPNDGPDFSPPLGDFNGDGTPGTPAPPAVGLIVKKNAAGQWMDDNNGNWTNLVSGANAGASGRPMGWNLPDRDIAIINTSTLAVRYATRLMNICMAIAVNPANGEVTLVGTDGINEVRFEPNVKGRFIRANMARVNPVLPTTVGIADLNGGHLDYTPAQVQQQSDPATASQALRDMSIGDPRGIAWNSTGTRAYITGMGSNNVIIVDPSGIRAGVQPTIDVGEGPTGVVFDEAYDQLYVLDKFGAGVSVVDLASETESYRVSFYDPSPPAIKNGRKHLYDTHKNSGLGHIACASCHVDARMDRLSWDLGDPTGTMKTFNQNCGAGAIGGCEDWHPMKGPMLTQTLQDIIGKEPLHWRGDREGLEAFNGAFKSLQGDDQDLTAAEMQQYEDFLATIHFPPNPFRNFDNTLPANLPLPGHFTTGRFAPAGQPLPNGNAQTGLQSYRTAGLDGGVNCVTCHTLPTGMGTDMTLQGFNLVPIPPGPNGERHHALVSVDGSTNVSIKIPHLRNLYERVGFEMTQTSNRAGFGLLHDGSIDSIARFVTEPVFSVTSDQQVANLVAFMLAFSGSDLPLGSPANLLEPPGPSSKDAHAAVGAQVTVAISPTPGSQLATINSMISLAQANRVGLVVKGRQGGLSRGYAFVGSNTFQSDRAADVITASALLAGAAVGSELTFTVVPKGSERRIGIDRDEDSYFDRDEIEACSDPVNPNSTPGDVGIPGDADHDGDVDVYDFAAFFHCIESPGAAVNDPCQCSFDFDADHDVDLVDFAVFQAIFTG